MTGYFEGSERGRVMIEGDVLAEIREFLKSRIILTGAELDFFSRLDSNPAPAHGLADELGLDHRALRRVLDCLVTFELLEKDGELYKTTERGSALSSHHPKSELPVALHMNSLWDSWGGLTEVVRTGDNPRRKPILERGEASQKAFIGAMHVMGRTLAHEIAKDFDLSPHRRLLDIGGASGTYTIAFLSKNPDMEAVLYDLPDVIPMAEERLAEEGFIDRVTLVEGDFYEDDLPEGFDLALLSAIIHQNSPQENVDLYKKVHRALVPGGVVFIRDHVMDESRLHPPAGAIFAINMLVNTSGGDTYTFEEIKETLEEVGFSDVKMIRKGLKMDCLVEGKKRG
jgi:SAM-dependent methyltransferase